VQNGIHIAEDLQQRQAPNQADLIVTTCRIITREKAKAAPTISRTTKPRHFFIDQATAG
jgi:hypothetical protein